MTIELKWGIFKSMEIPDSAVADVDQYLYDLEVGNRSDFKVTAQGPLCYYDMTRREIKDHQTECVRAYAAIILAERERQAARAREYQDDDRWL